MRKVIMKIGQLSALIDIPIQTIRFYEKEGLLDSPARGDNNYRVYDDASQRQLLFIKHCRNLGLALDEVRMLLEMKTTPESGCDDVNAIVDAHILEVDSRLQELTELRQQLAALRTKCHSHQTAKNCGILRELSEV
jgi:Cd(II)/Pb(II)-responsive transcriptional regulator